MLGSGAPAARSTNAICTSYVPGGNSRRNEIDWIASRQVLHHSMTRRFVRWRINEFDIQIDVGRAHHAVVWVIPGAG